MILLVELLSLIQTVLCISIVSMTIYQIFKLQYAYKQSVTTYYVLMQVGNGVRNMIQIADAEHKLFVPAHLTPSPTVTYQVDIWIDNKFITSSPFKPTP